MSIFKRFSEYKEKKSLLKQIGRKKKDLEKLLQEKKYIKELISDILEFTEDRKIDEEEFHKLREKAYRFLIDLDLDK